MVRATISENHEMEKMPLSFKEALQRLLFPLDFRTLKLTPVARAYRLLTKGLGFRAPKQLFCNISVENPTIRVPKQQFCNISLEIRQNHAPMATSGFQ